MAETISKAYCREWSVKLHPGAISRCAENGHENHAVSRAMIARAFIKQDPFVIWGNGEGFRTWIDLCLKAKNPSEIAKILGPILTRRSSQGVQVHKEATPAD